MRRALNPARAALPLLLLAGVVCAGGASLAGDPSASPFPTVRDDLDASGITVEVNNGVATLGGVVEQRWMKHRAEDLADSCSGVRNVENRLKVRSASEGMQSFGTSQESGANRASGGSQTGSPTTPTSGSTGTAHRYGGARATVRAASAHRCL